MSGTGFPTAEYIENLKKNIRDKLVKEKLPVIIESCLDFMLSQIHKVNDENEDTITLYTLFSDYFQRRTHNPLAGIPDSNSLESYFKNICDSGSVGDISTDTGSDSDTSIYYKNKNVLDCCLPCSCITLAGNRVIKSEPLNSQPDRELIKKVDIEDILYLGLIIPIQAEETAQDILLSYAYYGDETEIKSNTVLGIICQVWINAFNRGETLIKKQKNSTLLRTLGIRVKDTIPPEKKYSGLDIDRMRIGTGLVNFLDVVTEMKTYYNKISVIQTIESISGSRESLSAVSRILTCIQSFNRSADICTNGTVNHNIVHAIGQTILSFYVIITAADYMGIGHKKFEDIVDAVRNRRLYKKAQPPTDKSKTEIILRYAKDARNLAAQFRTVGLAQKDLEAFLDMNRFLVERFIAGFKEGTGIDLADNNWKFKNPIADYLLPDILK